METITLAGAVIAVVAFIKEVFPTKVQGWVTIVVAAALGIVAGLFNFQGLTVISGLLTAMAAVGTVTAVSKIG